MGSSSRRRSFASSVTIAQSANIQQTVPSRLPRFPDVPGPLYWGLPEWRLDTLAITGSRMRTPCKETPAFVLVS